MHRPNIMMQKLLIFDKLREYDAVIYLDNDVIINPCAPRFPFTAQIDQIWAVPHVPWEGVDGYTRMFGFRYSAPFIPQGGVIGLSGLYSYNLFKKIYWGKDLPQQHPFHAPDQLLLGMPFIRKNKCQWIDAKYNYNPDFFLRHAFFNYFFKELHLSKSLLLRSFAHFSRHIHLASPLLTADFAKIFGYGYFWHFAGANKQYIPVALKVAGEMCRCLS